MSWIFYPISFYRRASRFVVFQTKMAHLCFCLGRIKLPLLMSVFPLFSKDFLRVLQRENPGFFGGFSLPFSKGLEGQGIGLFSLKEICADQAVGTESSVQVLGNRLASGVDTKFRMGSVSSIGG